MLRLPTKLLKQMATLLESEATRCELKKCLHCIKLLNTDHLIEDYLLKMNWKVWETQSAEIGKYKVDPLWRGPTFR